MATKTAVHNENAPDYRFLFNWGLKISDFSELFLLAGLGDLTPDGRVRHPGDSVAQTRSILVDLKTYVEANGYALDDIIRVEFTLTKDVPQEAYEEIFGLFGEFFDPLAVKPAAGTLRVIEALAVPGMLVEYEIWLAK